MHAFFTRSGLVYQLARREIVSRYRGSALGLLWAVLQPLLMLAVYSFVFGHVMQARWPHPSADVPGMYALMLFSGLLLHAVLAECLTRSPGLIVSQPNFVKKVVFPLQILPLVQMVVATFHLLIGSALLLIAKLLVLGTLSPFALLLPLVWAPFVLLCLGLAWFLSALGVYLRDIGHVGGLAATVLLFLSPVLFPAEMLPEAMRGLVWLNPLSWPVEAARDLLFWNRLPDLTHTTLFYAGSGAVALLGYAFFQRVRKGFADVL